MLLGVNDDDSVCIQEQLQQARGKWAQIAKLLKREGANAVVMARFYRAIVQAVLLYRAESWAIMQQNMEKLARFHKQAARYMTGKHIKKLPDGSWSYPDHAALLADCR